jgi:formylmethanofuran dehydrogenase subunit D
MKNRRLTVGSTYFKEKEVPFIRLSGDWLKNLGFSSGQKVVIREEPGILVIQLAEEATL